MASLSSTGINGGGISSCHLFKLIRPKRNADRVCFRVFSSSSSSSSSSAAESSETEPNLSLIVNGLKMPNPFVIRSGPPGTNYTVMKRAFDEGWGAVIAKTVRLFTLAIEQEEEGGQEYY